MRRHRRQYQCIRKWITISHYFTISYYMEVSWNGGTPKIIHFNSISIKNQPFWGITMTMETPTSAKSFSFCCLRVMSWQSKSSGFPCYLPKRTEIPQWNQGRKNGTPQIDPWNSFDCLGTSWYTHPEFKQVTWSVGLKKLFRLLLSYYCIVSYLWIYIYIYIHT